MNAMTKLEEKVLDAARVRALQALYQKEHEALIEWGLWSLDRRGIYPTLTNPSMWEQFKRDGSEGYGAEKKLEPGEEDEANAVYLEVKAERVEQQEYDEKLAIRLDELIHEGLSEMVRQAIKTAYATREVPEYQFPMFSNCSTMDQYCERLELSLLFVKRWL